MTNAMPDLRPDNMTSARAAEMSAAQPPWLSDRLEWFSDLKFGLMLHWGLYSQWGCTESWPLVECEPWARDPQLPAWIESGYDLVRFKDAYCKLNETFNPRDFNPDAWVAAAQAAGMRYFNFVTKHHDGFCLFDTATTDYRATHPSCPFHDHPYANVARVLFDRFRAAGLAISCYFSKSDWHSPYYWSPNAPATTRNPNYGMLADAARWRKFVEFTHTQIQELMTGYGPIDVLWLDGGQVRPPDQDIDVDRLVAMARRHQPGLIVVDRTVGGPHENILTPEQQIPDQPLSGVWETCLTLGTSFSYKPNDEYKSVRQLIAILVDIVSKGGNLLLGVGADRHGALPTEVVERLKGVGAWLAVNGEAIYGTRSPAKWSAPFQQSDDALDIRYMRKGKTLYAIILAKPMQQRPPKTIRLKGIRLRPRSPISLLGVEEQVSWEQHGDDAVVTIPTAQLDREPARPAWVLRIECTKS
ncbi:MAG TPA: alpha-L-fucosidase [Phycisphaerae bacterium]|nr:alpha-L-fucosidase [Phycisphaerae bacterium]